MYKQRSTVLIYRCSSVISVKYGCQTCVQAEYRQEKDENFIKHHQSDRYYKLKRNFLLIQVINEEDTEIIRKYWSKDFSSRFSHLHFGVKLCRFGNSCSLSFWKWGKLSPTIWWKSSSCYIVHSVKKNSSKEKAIFIYRFYLSKLRFTTMICIFVFQTISIADIMANE